MYLLEIARLKAGGVISDYEGYLALPVGVLEDCRLVWAAENFAARRQLHHGSA